MRSFGSSRRALLAGMGCCCAACVGLVGTSGLPPAARAADAPRATLTPDEALARLKEGNANFVTDAPFRGVQGRHRRIEIARTQEPFTVLVGCSDSRVSPELLFGRGLGELFIVRVAGNTVDQAGLGSVEYAVAELGVPLVVVLGHERCGAVAAAVEVVERNAELPGAIGDMVSPIVPAVLRAKGQPGDLLDNAVRENVRRVVSKLQVSGELLEKPIAERRLKIVGARYDLDNGAVEFFEET